MTASFPWTDAQFWTVTAAAGGAVWLLVRPFLAGGRQNGGSCSQCGAAPGAPCGSTAAGRDRLVAIGGGRVASTRVAPRP